MRTEKIKNDSNYSTKSPRHNMQEQINKPQTKKK